MIETVLTFLYSLVGVAVCVGYLPQIYKLIKATEIGKDLSIATWFVWTITTNVTLAYSLLISQDMVFAYVSAVHAVGSTAILTLSTYNAYFRFRNTVYHRREGDTVNKTDEVEDIPSLNVVNA